VSDALPEPVASTESAPRRFALFSYGFRPFFLAAGLSAALVVPAWLVMVAQGSMPPSTGAR